MGCAKCWAYKWNGEHYCFIIGHLIKAKDIENVDPETCEDMLRYKNAKKELEKDEKHDNDLDKFRLEFKKLGVKI